MEYGFFIMALMEAIIAYVSGLIFSIGIELYCKAAKRYKNDQ